MSQSGGRTPGAGGRHRAGGGRHRAGGTARAARAARASASAGGGRHRAPSVAPTTVPTVLALATGLALAAAATADPAAAAAARTPTTPAPAPVRPVLQPGDTGRAVALLQRGLLLPDDGVYGPRTKAAVVAFQRRFGLTPDGVVGARTWTALFIEGNRRLMRRPPTRGRPVPSLHPVLEQGDHSADVTLLQRRLGIRPADGWFGARTLAAVTAYQKSRRLTADGVVGRLTWAALDTPRPAPAPKRPPLVRTCITARPYSFIDSFGAPRSGGRKHQGVDVMAPRNAPVLAIESGVVVRSYVNRLGGNAIILRGTVSRDEYYYAHQTRNLVRTGQAVRRGERIGLVGNTGAAAGGPTHIHFEWWPDGGAPVNPYPLAKQVCSR